MSNMANVMEIPEYTFLSPSTIIISGSTGCGKTTLLKRMLSTPVLFSKPVDRIIYCFGVWQDAFNDMDEVEFRKGVDIPKMDKAQHTILVFDDLMHQILKSPEAEEIFTGGSHHRNITVILVLQNLYAQGRFAKSINLNTHYMILMKNCRDIRQIRCLDSQAEKQKVIAEAYKDCMKSNYGYLVVDYSPHQSVHELKVKTNIFPGEILTVYL